MSNEHLIKFTKYAFPFLLVDYLCYFRRFSGVRANQKCLCLRKCGDIDQFEKLVYQIDIRRKGWC